MSTAVFRRPVEISPVEDNPGDVGVWGARLNAVESSKIKILSPVGAALVDWVLADPGL